MTSDAAYMELMFRPQVELISVVRRFVGEFCGQLVGDAEWASRMALATHELLENAAKYSSTGESRLRVQIARGPSTCRLSVRTWNEALPIEIESLKQACSSVSNASNPLDHYQRRLRETLNNGARSELGLARIRAEADLALDCHVEGAVVCVSAEADARIEGEP
jgi:anti-sigma regulatory factor (Ser/Thr protein kinase)